MKSSINILCKCLQKHDHISLLSYKVLEISQTVDLAAVSMANLMVFDVGEAKDF